MVSLKTRIIGTLLLTLGACIINLYSSGKRLFIPTSSKRAHFQHNYASLIRHEVLSSHITHKKLESTGGFNSMTNSVSHSESNTFTGKMVNFTLWQLFGIDEMKSEALARTWPSHKMLNKTFHDFSYKTCKQKIYTDVERNRNHLLASVAQNFDRSLYATYYGMFRYNLNSESKGKGVALVVGSSSNHFDEVQNFIRNISSILGQYRIIFYDIGLNIHQIELVKHHCQFCDYRRFNFSFYPKHVRQLKNYAFKPLIIQEVLKDHEVCIWFDASILFMANENVRSLDHFIQHVREKDILIWPGPGLINSVMTHPYTFSFFNEHPCSSSNIIQITAGFLGLKNSLFVQKMILMPWVACALEEDCMYAGLPINQNQCSNIRRRDREFSCHRYDQSALTTILNRVYLELPTPPKKQHAILRNIKAPTYFSG